MSEGDFTAYVQDNYDRFLRFLRRQVEQHAEDVLQGTILSLWTIHEDIVPEQADRLFFTALKHAAIDHWRKECREPDPREGMRTEADSRTPEQSVQLEEASQGLRARLAQARVTLTLRERRSLAVWLILHPSREAASSLLGVTLASYSGSVHTGLRKLTRALSPHQASLLQGLSDLGYHQAFALLAEAFADDLPEKK